MKDKINKVVKDLREGKINNQEAETLLLGLFSVSNRFSCSKCGKELSKRWEQNACNFRLALNIDCCSTQALFGENEKIGFKHPAIEEGSGYQGVVIKSAVDSDYRLCISCHREFTKMIGDFLVNGC